MKNQTTDINSGLGWLDHILTLIKNYGFLNILKAMFIMLISAWVIYLTLNPSYIFTIYEKFKTEEHNKALYKRIKNDPLIRLELDKLLLNTKANRASIIEFHNGISNNSGLPFLFGDMNFECVKDSTDYVSDFYHNVPLSKFEIATNLFKNRYWCGDMEELGKIDYRLSKQMIMNNVEWCYLIMLEGTNNDLGILCLSYDCTNINKEKCERLIRNASVKISVLLNNED